MDYDWSFMKCDMKYSGFMALAGLIWKSSFPGSRPKTNYCSHFCPLPRYQTPLSENGHLQP